MATDTGGHSNIAEFVRPSENHSHERMDATSCPLPPFLLEVELQAWTNELTADFWRFSTHLINLSSHTEAAAKKVRIKINTALELGQWLHLLQDQSCEYWMNHLLNNLISFFALIPVWSYLNRCWSSNTHDIIERCQIFKVFYWCKGTIQTSD